MPLPDGLPSSTSARPNRLSWPNASFAPNSTPGPHDHQPNPFRISLFGGGTDYPTWFDTMTAAAVDTMTAAAVDTTTTAVIDITIAGGGRNSLSTTDDFDTEPY
jgi:hypothetical protein